MSILSHGTLPVNIGRSWDGKTIPNFRRRPLLVALGEAICRARAGVGLSQKVLAVDADLDRSCVGGIERGEHNLSLMNVVKIADVLKVPPSALLTSAGF